MAQNQEPLITVTPSAAKRVHRLITEKKNENLKLRLYIVGGGCSGFQYGFSFEEQVNSDDEVIIKPMEEHPNKHITLLVDHLSLQYLENSTLDFVEGLSGSRFSVQNPNAETTCGCGASFSLKE